MSEILDRFRLAGRVAVVTGASRGLGRAIAHALGSAGAAVAVTSRELAVAEAAARELSAAGTAAIGCAVDVRDPGSVQAMVDITGRAFDRLDILVNNAGVTRRAPLEELDEAQWDEVLDTNLKGAWHCCRAALPMLRASGHGRVIHVSSMLGHVALANRSAYIASKGGLTALTRAMAVELAADAITVNAICPGPFETEMADAAARAGMLEQIPLARWGDPNELGPAAVFLASDAAAYVTGTTLTIDGGYTAR